jgi:hypothetical protein
MAGRQSENARGNRIVGLWDVVVENRACDGTLIGTFLGMHKFELGGTAQTVPSTNPMKAKLPSQRDHFTTQRILLAAALFFLPLIGHGADGGAWVRKADMPTARMGLSVCTVNGIIYAIGGASSTGQRVEAVLSLVDEYTPPVTTPVLKLNRHGRYKLRETLGEGGCGVVYVAEQEEPVRRLVALEVIKLGMDTKAVVARFGAERQALAMMDHPNIAKVFDSTRKG